MSDVLVRLTNLAVRVPAPSCRRRLWVRCGEQLQFATGIHVTVECDAASDQQDLRLRWQAAGSTRCITTCYEPVSLVDDCGMNVVIRAVALRGEVPIAVLVELETVAAALVRGVEVMS